MTTNSTPWGEHVEVEHVNGIPLHMYASRPVHPRQVLALGRRWGSRPHLVQGDTVVTFDQMLEAIMKKAAELSAHEVRPGDRVLVLGWNSPSWTVNFWACQVLGAVPALANTLWGGSELTDALELLTPTLVLADERGAGKMPGSNALGPWEADLTIECGVPADPMTTSDGPVDEAAAAVIIFTSGTAGRPKAVEISRRSLLANLQMLLQLTRRLPHQVTDDAGEVTLHTGPLFHVGGPQMLLRSVVVGNTIVFPVGRFDPAEILALIERHRIARWSAVPTMVTRVLDHPDLKTRDLKSLKALTIGGAPIHADLLRRVGRDLPGVQAGVPTGYGLTENGGQATAASGRDTLAHPGSAGRPLPCVELGFVAHPELPDAEILIRSPTQMTRYLGGESSPIDADGWLHTGDLGRLDDDGRLWITGRAKDLIIRGGENVAPASVERALEAVDGVLEVAVVGIPHPDLGEEVCAFVVTDARHDAATLTAALQGKIASFAVPTVWHLQSSPLPTNGTGKVDKPALVERACGTSEDSSISAVV